MKGRILIVEDELEVRDYLRIALSHQNYSTEIADDGDEAIELLTRPGSDVSLVLLDIVMPRRDGLDTLCELRRINPTLPVIMLSYSSSMRQVIEAIKAGATDVLQKPVSFEELGDSIERALHSKPAFPSQGPRVSPRVVKIDGEGAAPSKWDSRIEMILNYVGESKIPVLLTGETGVGKEVLARRLHARSPRSEGPFLKVNCVALPSELVESELFGYERGAFTGAIKASDGRFQQAHGGTIFLDEIGDMDVKLQAKLLQVLQDQEFLRLGAKEPTRVDVRIMAASHCDLEEAILDGRFREDLYYRLNVISIAIPALRDRRDEILGLAQHFLYKYASNESTIPEISPSLREALLNHDWPGNIRELENVMRKLLVFRDCELVRDELQRTRRKVSIIKRGSIELGRPSLPVSLPPDMTPRSSLAVEKSEDEPSPLRDLDNPFEAGALSSDSSEVASGLELVDQAKKNAEVGLILSALSQTRWNRRQAAAVLQIDYKALLYKMKKHRISA
jgi:DNA-binding NtrC family response regulator